MKARWIFLFLLAAGVGWLVSRPVRSGFMRIPGASFPAPAWTMTNLDGRAVESSGFAGKIVVLNFWATWCPPCLQELPELSAFQAAQRTNGVVVIGAATDEGGAAVVEPFVKRRGLNYLILLAGPEVQQTFAITRLPTTWIVGRDGRVVTRYLGALTEQELTRAIAPLLASQ